MSIETMKQALEALDAYSWEQVNAARAALRTAIEQAESVEPRCAVIVEVFGTDWRLDYMSLPVGKHKLYTQEYVYTTPLAAPAHEPDYKNLFEQMCQQHDMVVDKLKAAQRQWVSLTPEQVRQCFFGTDTPPSSPPYWWEYKDTDYMVIYNTIEAKLKEKNT